jgi:hypothetical protein
MVRAIPNNAMVCHSIYSGLQQTNYHCFSVSGVLQGHIWSDGYSITVRACHAFFAYSVSQALLTTSSFVAPCFYK